jgi:hypothetical protein
MYSILLDLSIIMQPIPIYPTITSHLYDPHQKNSECTKYMFVYPQIPLTCLSYTIYYPMIFLFITHALTMISLLVRLFFKRY